jgi:hypothetical protein
MQFQIITEETRVEDLWSPVAPFRYCLLAITTLHFISTAVSSGANYFFLILIATGAEVGRSVCLLILYETDNDVTPYRAGTSMSHM